MSEIKWPNTSLFLDTEAYTFEAAAVARQKRTDCFSRPCACCSW